MSEELRSILLEDLRIQWPGFVLRRLALNQHMPRVEKFSEHLHHFSQILVYLRGYGVQHIEGEEIPIARGAVLLIPAGVRHRFEKERLLRPVCLTLEFDGELAKKCHRMGKLGDTELAAIERWLVELHEWEKTREESLISIASCSLRLLELVKRVLTGSRETRRLGAAERRVLAVIGRQNLHELTPGKVAKELGLSLDHLNRQLRRECGLTVGKFISREKISLATEKLKSSSSPIGEVASELGFEDQNYFARWFRKETGQTPSRWRETMNLRQNY